MRIREPMALRGGWLQVSNHPGSRRGLRTPADNPGTPEALFTAICYRSGQEAPTFLCYISGPRKTTFRKYSIQRNLIPQLNEISSPDHRNHRTGISAGTIPSLVVGGDRSVPGRHVG